MADQGTIFFDEIATVSPETQAKLLRVIQEREFMRLGGTEQLKVDVRIVAASNIDLLSLVKEGRFREDLYHRLNVIHLQLAAIAGATAKIFRCCWRISWSAFARKMESRCDNSRRRR